jgi:hypothetical protein
VKLLAVLGWVLICSASLFGRTTRLCGVVSDESGAASTSRVS